jgi:hypothetical protein
VAALSAASARQFGTETHRVELGFADHLQKFGTGVDRLTAAHIASEGQAFPNAEVDDGLLRDRVNAAHHWPPASKVMA